MPCSTLVRRDRASPAEIDRTVVIGPGEVDQLDAFLDAGATHLIVMTGHPFDLDPVEALIARSEA